MNNTLIIGMRKNKNRDQLGFDWSATSIKLKDVVNNGFGILSQLIGNKNGGTQVAVNSGGQLSAVNPTPQYQTPAQNYPQNYNQNPNGNNNQSPYNAAADTASGISGLITKYPWLPIAALGALFLYNRDPKKR